MIIDGNPKEKAALEEYQKGNVEECHRLEAEFLSEFRNEYSKKYHRPCKVACMHHGNCKKCVALHRARIRIMCRSAACGR